MGDIVENFNVFNLSNDEINERIEFIIHNNIDIESIIDNNRLFNNRLASKFTVFNENQYMLLLISDNEIEIINNHLVNETFIDIIDELNNIYKSPFKIIVIDNQYYFCTKIKNVQVVNDSFMMNIGIGFSNYIDVLHFYINHIRSI